MGCLSGCIGSYDCGLVSMPDFVSMAPYVKLGFDSPEGGVTVGNNSFPERPHEAIIKNFEYGGSNGTTITAEIFDEQGGAFTKFWQNMPKKLEQVDGFPLLTAEWGWIGVDCNDNFNKKSSPSIKCVLTNIETSVSEGKIKFTVTAKDLMQYVFNSRATNSYGGDKTQKLPLKQAIINLFNDVPPKMTVKFLRKSENGSGTEEWKFNPPNPPDGPKDRWSSDNQNKLATAMEWLSPFRTEKDKGIVPAFDPTKREIIFWEDFDKCKNRGCSDSIGTFIVNGGKCSPVLEFSPKINWMVLYNKHGVGGTMGTATQKPVEKTGKIPGCGVEDDDKHAGVMHSTLLTAQAINAYGAEDALKETEKSETQHIKANAFFVGKEPIEAELRLVGQPDRKFVGVPETLGKTVSIVIINPFHLVGGGSDDCPTWLAEPLCNEYLSSKEWIVKGFNHNISEGSYTTTLKVMLPPVAAK